MNKKLLLLLIAVVLLIGLTIGGFFCWNYLKKSKARTGAEALEKSGEVAQKITESATQGALPSIGTNPMESKPDINPSDKANPFKNIKTNPF